LVQKLPKATVFSARGVSAGKEISNESGIFFSSERTKPQNPGIFFHLMFFLKPFDPLYQKPFFGQNSHPPIALR